MLAGRFPVFKGPLQDNRGEPIVPAGVALPASAIELESMNCLVAQADALGRHRADAGRFLRDGREAAITRAADADRLGLGMVYQHFTLVPSITVAENLVMARRDVPAGGRAAA